MMNPFMKREALKKLLSVLLCQKKIGEKINSIKRDNNVEDLINLGNDLIDLNIRLDTLRCIIMGGISTPETIQQIVDLEKDTIQFEVKINSQYNLNSHS